MCLYVIHQSRNWISRLGFYRQTAFPIPTICSFPIGIRDSVSKRPVSIPPTITTPSFPPTLRTVRRRFFSFSRLDWAVLGGFSLISLTEMALFQIGKRFSGKGVRKCFIRFVRVMLAVCKLWPSCRGDNITEQRRGPALIGWTTSPWY